MSLKTKLKVENMSYVAVEGYAGTLCRDKENRNSGRAVLRPKPRGLAAHFGPYK